jgi:hypothetical protein
MGAIDSTAAAAAAAAAAGGIWLLGSVRYKAGGDGVILCFSSFPFAGCAHAFT